MTTFEYKGYDASGHAQNGLIEAEDLKDARKRLAARGLLPEMLQAAGGQASRRAAKATSFSPDIRTMFYRELAALLGSGVALVPALDVILQAPELDRARARLAAPIALRSERCRRNASTRNTMRGSGLHHRIGSSSLNHGKMVAA